MRDKIVYLIITLYLTVSCPGCVCLYTVYNCISIVIIGALNLSASFRVRLFVVSTPMFGYCIRTYIIGIIRHTIISRPVYDIQIAEIKL